MSEADVEFEPAKLSKDTAGSADLKSRSDKSGSIKKLSSNYIPSMLPATTNLEEMKIEQLYLLEILVNSIEVHKESSLLKVTKDQESPPLHVRIKFIDFPCIEISQDDFLSSTKDDSSKEDIMRQNEKETTPASSFDNHIDDLPSEQSKSVKSEKSVTSKESSQKSEKGSKNADKSPKGSGKGEIHKPKKGGKPNITLGTGKSCLFPMVPLELLRQIQRHPITLHVYRKNAENETMMIGLCKIKLGQEFEDSIVKAVFENLPLPLTTTTEHECKLVSTLGDTTGRISVFVRLSCFGATIVTNFQLLGQESEGYIFKTSKKDNTLEAQKKKNCGFLFSKSPYKKENVVKSLNMHDISPFKPVLATEENAFGISGEISNPYLKTAYKVVPWRKYVTDCGCENPDEDDLETDECVPFGSCGCGKNNNLPSYIDQTRMCDVPPCPLPDCDCYSSTIPNKPYQRNEPSANNVKNFGTGCCKAKDGTNCMDCKGSSSGQPEFRYSAQNNNYSVEDSHCSPKLHKTSSPPPAPPSTREGSLESQCCMGSSPNMNKAIKYPVNDCECFNSRQRVNFIRKKCPPVSTPFAMNSKPIGDCGNRSSQSRQSNPQTNCPVDGCGCLKNGQMGQNFDNRFLQTCPPKSIINNTNKQFGSTRPNCPNIQSTVNPVRNNFCSSYSSNTGDTSKKEETRNCFFSDYQQKQTINSNHPNNSQQSDPLKCKIGYNNRNECFCYGGGTTKPYSDTYECKYMKMNYPNLGRDYKSGYEASGGSVVSGQGVLASHVEESLQALLEEEKNSQKVEEIGGGDSNWQDSGQKSPTKEKSEEYQKQTEETVKKSEELQDGNKEPEQEQVPKPANIDEKVSDEQNISEEKHHAKKKRKFRSIFQYTAGMYPGIAIGHRHCTKEFRFVPKTMGWLWNTEDLGDNLRPRRGWRPGAINRNITKMIREGKLAAGLLVEEENEEKKTTKGTKRVRRQFTPRSGGVSSNQNSGEYMPGPQPPTLHLHKKDGAYFISMNPLKNDSDDEEEERTPLMFKILPHEDEASTSSESSLEIEFTAPGAFRKKPLKPVMETIDTQYSDPESLLEIMAPPTQKGKKGAASKKGTESIPPSTMASVAKDNKWDADQPTQVAKTKK